MRVSYRLLLLLIVVFYLGATSQADTIELIAGGMVEQVGIDGKEARLYEPFAAEYDASGELWIVEMAQGNRLLRLDTQGLLQHEAGKVGARRADEVGQIADIVAENALFHGPHNLAVLDEKSILISDTWNGRIRQFDRGTRTVTSLTGYGVELDAARGNGPYCVTLSPNKTMLYIADLRRVYKLEVAIGQLTLVAGNGERGVPADGELATDSPLVDPRAVAADSQGNVYILERNGNALRVVGSDGRIRTVVNRSGKKGNGKEEGRAIDIGLSGPKHLCMDQEDRVVIADAESHMIRRYDPKTELISTILGNGEQGRGEIGEPLQSFKLSRPHGVSIDPRNGDLIITDSYNHRVLRRSGSR